MKRRKVPNDSISEVRAVGAQICADRCRQIHGGLPFSARGSLTLRTASPSVWSSRRQPSGLRVNRPEQAFPDLGVASES